MSPYRDHTSAPVTAPRPRWRFVASPCDDHDGRSMLAALALCAAVVTWGALAVAFVATGACVEVIRFALVCAALSALALALGLRRGAP